MDNNSWNDRMLNMILGIIGNNLSGDREETKKSLMQSMPNMSEQEIDALLDRMYAAKEGIKNGQPPMG